MTLYLEAEDGDEMPDIELHLRVEARVAKFVLQGEEP